MKKKAEEQRLVILVTGMSGAGKSTTLDVLSDLGLFAIYNLPVPLLPEFINLARSDGKRFKRAAILLELDPIQSFSALATTLGGEAADSDIRIETLFLDCSADVIIRRYSETRRPHPSYDSVRDKTLLDTIERERDQLLPFKELANHTLDTSQFTVHDLKRELKDYLRTVDDTETEAMRINFLSFGFKYGLPRDCDLIADVRFLPNPYFVDSLRDKSGLDQEVSNYVLMQKDAAEFVKLYANLLKFLIPRYSFEGKAYVNIGIGCTGGKHRSVSIAQCLSQAVQSSEYLVGIKHRDIERS